MISEFEIFQTAGQLLTEHGGRAVEIARAEALKLIDADDWRAATFWCRIVVALEVLKAPRRGPLS